MAKTTKRKSGPTGVGVRTFNVPPGGLIIITVTFAANWENQIEIGDVASGNLAMVYNNYFFWPSGTPHNINLGGTWQYHNPAATEVVISVNGQHKQSQPNGNAPWLDSEWQEFPPPGGGPNSVVLGYEDDGGGPPDWNDAMASIEIYSNGEVPASRYFQYSGRKLNKA